MSKHTAITAEGDDVAPLFRRASNHDLDCRALLLRPEGCSILLLEHEGAAGVDRVGIENALVRLARDCAGLATLSHDETNDRSARSGRARRSSGSSGARRARVALFALGGGLPLASRKGQGRRQQQNKEPANLHLSISISGCYQVMKLGQHPAR